MKRTWPLVSLGVVLIGVGSVWTLQGVGVLGGSVMTGSPVWAVIGPIVLAIGVVLIVGAIVIARRRRETR